MTVFSNKKTFYLNTNPLSIAYTSAIHTHKIDKMKRSSTLSRRHIGLLVIGILLVAVNLRAPFTAVSPILDIIKQALALNSFQVGLLTTLPLLCFALISPISATFAQRFGLEKSILMALIVIGVGIILRSYLGIFGLYFGTSLIGGGIAVCNVLLPSILKKYFPTHVTHLTAIYFLTMGIVAALGSICIMPLSQTSGWSNALLSFLILPIITALIWLPQLKNNEVITRTESNLPSDHKIWSSHLAWYITLFLGLNSFIYYTATTWLPSLLSELGYSANHAAQLHGLLQLATSFPGLVMLPFINKLKNFSLAAFGATLFVTIGVLGLSLIPTGALIWVSMMGFGSASAMILGFALISLRASHYHQAAAISGMAQSIGYLLAAVGPIMMGAMHDLTQNWHLALLICILLSLVMAFFGYLSGRDRSF